MISRKIALLICVLMFICSCATLQQFVKMPSVSFQGLSFKNMSFVEGDAVFKLKVTNPNPIGANLTRVAYNLRINDKQFLKNVMNKNIALAAGGSSIVEVPVTINYMEFFQSVTEFVQSDKVAYDLSGSVGVGPLDIPYQKKGDLTVPKLPKVSLKKIAVSNPTIAGVSVILSLGMENSNPFTLDLSGLNYSIKLGGMKFAEGSATHVSPIGKNSSSTLEIPLRVNFFEASQSLYNLLTKSSSEYELAGEMKFHIPETGEKRFPFQTVGKVPFN